MEKLIKTDQDFIQVLHVTTIAFLALSVGLFVQLAVRIVRLCHTAHTLPNTSCQMLQLRLLFKSHASGRWKMKTMVRVYQNDTQAAPLAVMQALCKQFASGWMPSVAPEAAAPIKKLRLTCTSLASYAESQDERCSESCASTCTSGSD